MASRLRRALIWLGLVQPKAAWAFPSDPPTSARLARQAASPLGDQLPAY
jgi:hypothetical protein